MNTINSNPKQELEQIILRGYCPYCQSKQIKYYEIAMISQFEFACYSCGWRNRYDFEQFFSLNDSLIAKGKNQRDYRYEEDCNE